MGWTCAEHVRPLSKSLVLQTVEMRHYFWAEGLADWLMPMPHADSSTIYRCMPGALSVECSTNAGAGGQANAGS